MATTVLRFCVLTDTGLNSYEKFYHLALYFNNYSKDNAHIIYYLNFKF